MTDDSGWFENARYGLFIHYGLYSLLGRGEWVMNREQIPVDAYAKLADRFTAEQFDAEALIGRARKDWGMRYVTFTCKHHDGFCLYDSSVTDFNSAKTACGRDLVAEVVEACRKHGMKIALYHSLNDWSTSPNAVDALENPDDGYEPFIAFVHGQIREIMTRYGKIDVMWYDGWWPFDAKGWRAKKLNAMVRELQPGILVNGRCGIPGDFATPERHLTASAGMWEACMTLNDSWGFHKGDENWKSPKQIAGMLRQAAAGAGNLLLNVGPKGDGSIPDAAGEILDRVGAWLRINGEAIYDSDRFDFDYNRRGAHRADWTHSGKFTARGNNIYVHMTNWPGAEFVVSGVECEVTDVRVLGGESCAFTLEDGVLRISGLPESADTTMPVVLRLKTNDTPMIYRCGGHRNPRVPHWRYDPCPSDIQE
ncbi:MAG: alpha-L-fucosidase [Kiritimatiellae bacterium]|nr:alpha-L-fucosidase [Kiritimatiellia bacterium]